MSLAEIFRLHGRFRPTKVAIVEGDRRIDYASLDRRINGFALSACAAGIGRGTVVGVGLGDTADHLIALLGLARIGALILPIDRRWGDDEVAGVTTAFRAQTVLVEPDRPGDGTGWLRPDASWFAESGTAQSEPAIGPDLPLLISLSSGTTGQPKGPVITHGEFQARFLSYWLNLGFSAADRFVSATPLYFGGGRGFALGTLTSGATVVMFPPPFAPDALVACVNAHRATSLFLVPTLLRRVLALPGNAPAMPTMRCLISSGSALHASEKTTVQARVTPYLHEMYSSSEGGAVSVLTPGDAAAHGATVGRAVFGVEVETVDAEGRALAPGETGVMRYRGPGVPKAFPNAEPGAFADGWLYPGDLAAIDSDGFIHLRGRIKDMIIRGGVNIYPGDIETVLLASGLVSEAAVVGVPHEEMGEEIVVFYVADDAVPEDELTAWCRARLASYKVPRTFVRIAELPRNNGGKVMKPELLAHFARLPSSGGSR